MPEDGKRHFCKYLTSYEGEKSKTQSF